MSWLAELFGTSTTDPIVLDMSGIDHGGASTGVQLTNINSSNAYFDLHGNGFAVHTGWVSPTTGILVDTATPTSINDLFGNSSTDGFTALKALDVYGSGALNSSDPGWSSLYVWQDANGNGVADPGEVKSLSDLGITSISLNAAPLNESVNGNLIGEVATFTYGNGSTAQVAEAFFDNSQLDSTFTGSYTLNPETLVLPNLRGYGTVPDLNIAMSLDPTLLGMVEHLAHDSLSDAGSFKSQVKQILYHWAGVENVDPSSRGSYVNAQDLGVVEAFTGETFGSLGKGADPVGIIQAEHVEGAFNILFSAIEERLLVQGPLAPLFPNASFNYDTDTLQGTVDIASALTAVAAAAPADTLGAAKFWASLAPVFADLANDFGVAQADFQNDLTNAVAASGLPADHVLFAGNSGLRETLNDSGSSGNDTLIIGTGDYDLAFAGSGNDVLIAADGNFDQLYAGSGNDVLVAGDGSHVYMASTYNNGASLSMTAGNGSNDYLDATYASGTTTVTVGDGDNDTIVGGHDGTSVLTAGNGDNDTLMGNGGVTTMTAGTGNDTFKINASLASGSSITGGGGNDTLEITNSSDITGVAISGVQTLKVDSGQSVTLTAAQFAQFSTVEGVFNNITGQPPTIYGTTAGTYDLSSVSTDAFNIYALSSDGTTLIGNNANYNHLFASATGNDTLRVGNGYGDQLYAGGGNDVLTAGDGSNVYMASTYNSGNTLSMTAGNGDNDDLEATYASGSTTVTVGNGDNDTLSGGYNGTSTLTAGNGDNDTLIARGGITIMTAGTGNDTFKINASLASGSSITGGGGHDTLEIVNGSDITGVSISGVQALKIDTSITMTATQLAEFTTINGVFNYGWGQPANLYGLTAGTYDLSAVSPDAFSIFAMDSGGTTLIGNDANYNRLHASASGNDTLRVGNGYADQLYAGGGNDVLAAGNGSNVYMASTYNNGATLSMSAGNGDNDDLEATYASGTTTVTVGDGNNDTLAGGYSGTSTLTAGNGDNDTLIANGGVTTMTAGTGNDTFKLNGTLASGSSIMGGGGHNTLEIANPADITGVLISGVQTLKVDAGVSVTLTAAQFAQFTSVYGTFNGGTGQPPTIYGTTAGTYDLSSVSSDAFNLYALSSGGTTLIGNNANYNHFHASTSGDDTLRVGNGYGDQLYAGGGNDTLIAGDGSNVYMASTYNNGASLSMTSGNGDNDDLEATYASGSTTVAVGNGNNDTLSGGIGGTSVLTAGNGNNDTLIARGGSTTMVAGSGDDNFIVYGGDASMQGGNGTNFYDLTSASPTGSYVINNYHTDGSSSSIRLGSGSSALNESFEHLANDLVIMRGNQSITVQNWFTGSAYQVASVEFADGTSLTAQQINALFKPTLSWSVSGLSAGTNGPVASVKGATQSGNTVSFYDGTSLISSVVASAVDGSFTANLPGLSTGEHSISAVATSSAGGVSDLSSASLIEVGTAATIAGQLNTLAQKAGLSAIWLTDTHVLPEASVTAMTQVIANDQAALSKIVGGYSFAVTTTTPGTTKVVNYDASGHLTSTVTTTYKAGVTASIVTVLANGTTLTASYTNGIIASEATKYAAGSPDLSDSKSFTAGVLTRDTVVHADGSKDIYVYQIQNQSYVAEHDTYNAAGVLTSITRTHADGSLAYTYVLDASGNRTTDQYDASGVLKSHTALHADGSSHVWNYVNGVIASEVIKYAAGSPDLSDTKNYASGVLANETIVHADHSKDVWYYGITGRTYVAEHDSYNAASVLISITRTRADGSVDYTYSLSADGTKTSDQYDAADLLKTQSITHADGSSDTWNYVNGVIASEVVKYAAGTADISDSKAYTAGVLANETVVHADHSKDVYLSNITGHTYVSEHDAYNAAGVLTSAVRTHIDGSVDYTFSLAPDGTKTSDQYDASSSLKTKSVVHADGSSEVTNYVNGNLTSDVIKYAASAPDISDSKTYTAGLLTNETIVHADHSKDVYFSNIGGHSYVSEHDAYNASGILDQVLRFHADGTEDYDYNLTTDGTKTTNQYDATGALTSHSVVHTDGSSDTFSYVAGLLTRETAVHADKSKDIYQSNITGKTWTAEHVSYNTAGALTSIDRTMTDGSHQQTAYVAGTELDSTAGVSDLFTSSSAGGDTFVFKPGSGTDTVTHFHAGSLSNADILDLLGQGNFQDFATWATSHLHQATGSPDTVVDVSPTDHVTLKGIAMASLTAANFHLVI